MRYAIDCFLVKNSANSGIRLGEMTLDNKKGTYAPFNQNLAKDYSTIN